VFVASGGLDAIGCYTPTTNLDAPTKNLPNVKHKHVDQPAEQRATPYRIHSLPLFYSRGCWQLIFKNVCVYARCFVQCYKAYCIISVGLFYGPDKGAFYACAYII